MRLANGFFQNQYTIPESRNWRREPVDTDTLDTAEADDVSLGQFLLTDDGSVVYVVDIFPTEDGFQVILAAQRSKDLVLFSSNATFFALSEGEGF